MASKIQLRRDSTANWASVNPVLAEGEIGINTTIDQYKIGDGATAWNSLAYSSANISLNDIGDVTITSAASGDFLKWNGSAWVNDAINLSTDTVGDYVASLVQGTGVTVTNNSGEGATPTIAIGQAVGTSASVTFAAVTGALVGNANTASELQTARTISLTGDVTGSVSFSGSADASITATIAANSVALGTDTTGNYVSGVSQGTGVTVSHTPGEGSTATIAIGQDVATNASVSFAKVTTTGDVVVGGDLTVNGTTTTLNTENLTVEDNIIVLNSNVSGSPTVNAGIEIERGDSANVVLRWNESSDSWEITEDGSVYKNIATGQDVETSSSVTFAAVTGPLIGNASTASALQTARAISLSGDLSGSVSFSGSTDVTISAVIQPDSVALGTDTTGNYVSGVSQGTGVTVTHTPGEGSTATIAIGQSVATNASVTIASVSSPVVGNVTGNLTGNADTATQLQTARAISLTGDVTGSVSFSGSADASITATIAANSVSLGTDTTGNYLVDLSQGTGVTISHTPGEGSTATIAIGQDVSASAVPTFGGVNLNGIIVFEGTTANDFETFLSITDPTADRTITLPDATGTVALNGSIALGTDTTGSYVTSLVQGTGVTISNNSGESATPTIAIGQEVGTSASVTFAKITMSGPVDGSSTVATKQYVDQVAAGIDWHESVALASVAALPNGPAYDNGSSGDGATLTASASARLVVDGSNAVTGTRILVKNQANSTHNGVYYVTEQGSVSVAWVLTRAEDFDGDTGHEIFGGEAVFVTGGTVNIRQGLVVTSTGSGTNGAHEFATDDVLFTQFTGTSAFVSGDGLTTTGNTINVVTANSGRIVVGADSIDLATINQTNTNGSDGVSFVQSQSIDSYGRVTGTVSATVQDASTSLKGIARFNSNHFSVSSGSVSIGQAVGTSSSVTFAVVNAPLTGNVTGNADTATQLQTARTISLTGDVTGSVSFSGSADASISATIAANSVALGTDTTGNYLVDLSQGTGITITHTPGEGSTATIAIGQDVAASATPSFNGLNINAAGTIIFEGTTDDSFETTLSPGNATADRTITLPDSTGTVALTANKLSAFAATSSSELAGVLSDETGTGALVFANTPTLVTPDIGAATGTSLVLSGDLTVNGTTVTVNSTTVTIDDPIFTLGGDTAPGSDDNKDRGIEFRYHSGTAASVGFMGYDDSSQMFTFLVGATNSSEVFSGTTASINVGMVYIGGAQIAATNLLNGVTGSGSVALSSSAALASPTLSGSVAFDASASVTLPAKTFFPEEYLAVSSSVTLSSTTHRYATLEMTASAGTSVISVPTDASDNFPIGTVIQIIRVGAGEVQVTAVTPGTTTVNNALGTRLRVQYSTATLRKRAANTWLLSGDLKV